MGTTFDEVRKMAKTQVTKLRWALGISGALSVALGVVIIIWPSISLYSLVIVFGAFALARGIVSLVTAIGNSHMPGRGWLAFSGIAGIVVGVIVFADTNMSALALLYVIGAYAIIIGLAELTVAIGGKRVFGISDDRYDHSATPQVTG